MTLTVRFLSATQQNAEVQLCVSAGRIGTSSGLGCGALSGMSDKACPFCRAISCQNRPKGGSEIWHVPALSPITVSDSLALETLPPWELVGLLYSPRAYEY